MEHNEASAYAHNETTIHVAAGHRTANPVARSLFTRRKAILYGTAAKVNPARTACRRMAKIASTLGTATAYYCWIIERIGAKDRTRFWINDAAAELGTSSKTIKRYNQQLEAAGFITIIHRKYKGLNTYCEYVANPINDLINDHGKLAKDGRNVGTALSPRVGRDKAVPAKRAGKEERDVSAGASSSRSSVSFPHPSGAEQAEAGRAGGPGGASPAAATAGFATKGDDDGNTHAKAILAWVHQNEMMFTTLGFKPQNPSSLVKDILRYTEGSDERWNDFVLEVWPVLVEQCRASDWLSQGRCRVGFGWLFLPSRDEQTETNLTVFMFSKRYTDLVIPKTVFSPGDRVMVYGQPTPKIILGFRPASLTTYRLRPEMDLSPEEVEINTIEVSWGQLSPAAKPAESTVLASRGVSEGLAVVDQGDGRPEGEGPLAATESEDDELMKMMDDVLKAG